MATPPATIGKPVDQDIKDPWAGAVTFPNGAVYFPNRDEYVLPNGYVIQNNADAKKNILKYLNEPPPQAPQPGKPQPIYDPGVSRAPTGIYSPQQQKTYDFLNWLFTGKPPATDTPPPTSPPTDPGTPTGTPGTEGDFSKGQPFFDSFPGGGQYGGNPGYDPYFGMGSNFANLMFGGWGSASPPGQNNRASSFDPLGIGDANYQDPNASYYPMVGANSVTGYSGNSPKYGIVGANGGYGLGMVGPDYTGPIWNDVPEDLNNLVSQREKLTTPTQARFTGKPAANPPASGGGTNVPGDTAPTKGGQPAGGPPAGSPGSVTPPAQGPGYYKNAQGQLIMADPGTFHTQFGDLVQSSVGDQNIFKVNGGSDNDLYHYDPRVGWKHMTADEYRGYNNPSNFYADPRMYGQQAGQVYRTVGTPLGTPIQGSGSYLDLKGTDSYRLKADDNSPYKGGQSQYRTPTKPSMIRRGGGRTGF